MYFYYDRSLPVMSKDIHAIVLILSVAVLIPLFIDFGHISCHLNRYSSYVYTNANFNSRILGYSIFPWSTNAVNQINLDHVFRNFIKSDWWSFTCIILVYSTDTGSKTSTKSFDNQTIHFSFIPYFFNQQVICWRLLANSNAISINIKTYLLFKNWFAQFASRTVCVFKLTCLNDRSDIHPFWDASYINT